MYIITRVAIKIPKMKRVGLTSARPKKHKVKPTTTKKANMAQRLLWNQSQIDLN